MDGQPYTGPNLGPLQGNRADDWSAFPEAGGSTAKADDWSAFPEAGAVTAGGLAQAGGIGVAKGAIGLAGMAGDLQQLAKKGADWVADKIPELPENRLSKFLREESAKVGPGAASGGRGDQPGTYEIPTSQDIQGAVEGVTGPFRKPQNQAERDVETAGEFLPAALAGPGGLARKIITQDAIPAAAAVVAGRYSDQNPYVKALAGFLGGGVGAVAGASSPAKILRGQLPDFVTEAHIDRAGRLIEHAQQRGMALTWPEALSRVTGQPVLTDTQRILESHAQTRPRMQEFFSERPQQIEGAARQEFDHLGQLPASPSTIGPQAREIADDTVNGFRQQINQAAEPFYRAAENVRLTPAEMSHVRAIPGWTEARDAVRQGPNAWRVQHLPDESVGFLNAVKKHFDQAAENSASKFNPARNKETQSTHEMQASAVRQIAEVKSVDYQIALQIQRQAREQFLDPILQGPIGKLAKKDMTTQKAIAVLFPENPVPGTEGEIRNAVFALARQRPAVAEQLVRAHVEMVFNQAARDLQGGANQFAGAKFAVKLAGGAQQRENLRAAIEALPHGTARWEGFEQLLDIMQATGARQPKGSLTAFNQLEVQSMTSGGIQELASKGLSPGKWMSYANDTFKAWSLGRNLDSLAQDHNGPTRWGRPPSDCSYPTGLRPRCHRGGAAYSSTWSCYHRTTSEA
jgi:DNA-binding GntR family transcriptional regulator